MRYSSTCRAKRDVRLVRLADPAGSVEDSSSMGSCAGARAFGQGCFLPLPYRAADEEPGCGGGGGGSTGGRGMAVGSMPLPARLDPGAAAGFFCGRLASAGLNVGAPDSDPAQKEVQFGLVSLTPALVSQIGSPFFVQETNHLCLCFGSSDSRVPRHTHASFQQLGRGFTAKSGSHPDWCVE